MTEIAPDGFDLESALRQPSTTPKSDRPRCPECNHLLVRKKTGKPTGITSDDSEYYCNRCLAQFDEPVYASDRDD